jgi:AraC-like DNA-binding protein
MERASELMHRSYMTLREVADECGFCNEFHFSRRFKQIVGLSPKEYRKQLPR